MILILGLLIGSFINVCIYRIPLGESIAFPPSHCSKCQHPLSPMDLIPVLSFLFLRGRCRYCREQIAYRYPFVEILVALLFLLVYRKYGYSINSAVYLLLVGALVTVSFIDYDHMIIPNKVNIFIGILGILGLLINRTITFKEGLLGFIIGGGTLYILGLISLWLLKKEGMGGGDIKLMAVCGLTLGIEKTLLSFLISCYLAGFIILFLFLSKKLKKGQYVPFGPFLSMGVYITLLFSEEILYFILP